MTDALPASNRRPPREAGRRLRRKLSVVPAAVIAWLGLLVHNVADLPDQTPVSPETLWPGLLNLIGGTLSVMPLPALLFDPEQTLRHYSFHLLYAATQTPLLAVSCQLAVGPRSAPPREAAGHVAA